MEYRLLGRSGLKVSTLSFGAMTFGGSGGFATIGNTDVQEATRQVELCLDAGVNLFDTADIYSAGKSEEILGEALGANRKRIVLATKCAGPTGPGVNDVGTSRHHIVEACENSLRRLNTDYIDLYQVHNQDLITPVEETLRALDDLVRAGKVRYVGSSNYAGWTKMRALATSDRRNLSRFVSQQIQYSLLCRDVEDELLPLGVQEGVGALIWGPLAAGYLSGKYTGKAAVSGTRLVERDELATSDSERARRVLAVVEEIASARNASPSQVAINWIARRAGVASVIIGARTSSQLNDNLAASLWSLSDAEMGRLDEVSATKLRYPYGMHRAFAQDRNPTPPLLPPIPDAHGRA